MARYLVIAPLGAGGMGEVYKAQDPSLERVVALKILPPDLVRNDERVRRFVQEAKSASSLNHPHIITIYEIGETRISEQSIHYIAMELVDGATLKEKIHRDATPLRTLLEYLAQAADGLAKAHAAGIIHRDLKPENIMVTRDGFAKVLDFGLAKLSAKKAVTETSVERTAVRDDTREGSILGTVAYMSPEQVGGKVVDHRSDIFSFGSILYEAATRQRPFHADSDVDIMHRIVHDKPVPVDEIAPTVPAELRRLIRRCLAKDPDKRYQSMKDLSLELSEIADEFDGLSASASSHTSGSVSQPVVASPPSRRAVWLVAAIVAIAAAGFGTWAWRQRKSEAPKELVSFGSMRIQRRTSSVNIAGAAISRDGKLIVHYDADGDGQFSLRVLQVNTGTDVRIVGPIPTRFAGATFSPDGDYVYYATRETRDSAYSWLYQIPTLGGTPRKVVFDVDSEPSFSPDGKSMVFARGLPNAGTDVLIMPVAGGTPRSLVKQNRLRAITAPAWSPDGKTIVIADEDLSGGLHVTLNAVDVTSGARRPIGSTRWLNVNDLTWLPDGSGLLLTATDPNASGLQVWLQPFPAGDPVRVTNDLNSYTYVTATADGKSLAVIQQSGRADLTIDDKPLPHIGNQNVTSVSTSRAGSVAYAYETDAEYGVAIVDAPGAAPRTVRNGGKSYGPSLTADGKTLVFSTERQNEATHVFITDADGASIRQVTAGSGEGWGTVSPDGSTIAYWTADSRLFVMPAAGGAAREIPDKVRLPFVHFSPDSKLIAYSTWESEGNRFVGHVKARPVAGGPVVFDTRFSAVTLRWLPDGKALAMVADNGLGIAKFPLDGGPPVPLVQLKRGAINGFDFMPDGKLILARGEYSQDIVTISDFRRTDK